MDLSASIFGVILLAVGVGLTYLCGIKPDRDQRKRRAEQAREHLRGLHTEKLRQNAALRRQSITNRP